MKNNRHTASRAAAKHPLLMLAPMAGYTDSAFRTICLEHDCDMVFTEVVNAAAIVRKSKVTMHLLETLPNERPVCAHIYGSDPSVMAEAARIIENLQRFDAIDINCGCPVRKIVAKGCGAALMEHPGRIRDIVKAVVETVSLPVTVKTRLGAVPERPVIHEIARAAEEGGASRLHVHARYTLQRHEGRADWDKLAQTRTHCRIPVTGNGGVFTSADAAKMISETGVDAVMIARGAVGNPWIFAETRKLLNGETCEPPSPTKLRTIVEKHLQRLVSLKTLENQCKRKRLSPDRSAALHFRAHLCKYLAGLPGCRDVVRGLQDMNSIEGVMSAVDYVIEGKIR